MIFALALFFGLCLSDVYDAYATSTASELQKAEDEKEKTENRMENAQDDLNDLNHERAGLQTYLDQLNGELNVASAELSDIERLISEKQEQIVSIQENLKKAKEDELIQYEAMKRRIRFLYERGDTAYIEMLLKSDGMGDFLNKAIYAEEVFDYDRNMLQNYMKLQQKIEADEVNLTDEETALKALRDQAVEKQNEVTSLIEETGKNLSAYTDQISEKEQQLIEYEKQLEQSENDIASLKKKLEEEQEISRQANLAGFKDLSDISFAAGDIDLMAAIIECEAGGEPYVGKVAVGNVVMNRVASPLFPNTVLEVLYQNRQFSPVGSGRFSIVLARGANATCYQAAQDAMSGSAPVGNCLFFRTPIPGLVGTPIGGHVFY